MCGVYRHVLKGNMTEVYRTPVRLGEKNFRYKVIEKVISGTNHSFVLSQGKVYAWGDPEVGVLGRKPSLRRKFRMGLMIMQLPAKDIIDVFTGDHTAYFTKITKSSKKKKGGQHQTFSMGLNNYG